MRRMPSFNGLRAFEAAARHGSFMAAGQRTERHPGRGEPHGAAARGAARLSIVRAASQRARAHGAGQGAAAEPDRGVRFDRRGHRASGSDADHAGADAWGRAFFRGALDDPAPCKLPREHPEIEVRLATGGAINPFRDDWTCGILIGNGDWPGYEAEPLFSADLFPVCTAAIAQRLDEPSALAKESLLQVAHSPEDWPLWLKAAG